MGDPSFALVVFGCTHCIAWNFAFPSKSEQILSRISSILAVSALPTLFAVNYLSSILVNTLRPNPEGIRARISFEVWVQWILGAVGGLPSRAGFYHSRSFSVFGFPAARAIPNKLASQYASCEL